MFKNTAGQSVTFYVVDASTGLPKTGDSANILTYVSKDDGTVTLITAASGVPTEVDATNAKGLYKIALSQAETNADKLLFSGKSSTANIVVAPAVLYTIPASWTIPLVTLCTTVTTVTNQLTAAAIATGIWQDTTAGDFTTASSIGKSLFTSGNAPGAASGLALVGSNMGTVSSVTGAVSSVTGAVGSVTGNVGGNVVGSVGSVVGNVGGNVVGSVASVTAGVTVTTNNDKTGYTLTITPPTAATIATAVMASVIETGVSLTQAVQRIGATTAGKLSGSQTATEVFVGMDGSTTRVTVTVDSQGNRTSIVYV